jgi:hypothetical protein
VIDVVMVVVTLTVLFVTARAFFKLERELDKYEKLVVEIVDRLSKIMVLDEMYLKEIRSILHEILHEVERL